MARAQRGGTPRVQSADFSLKRLYCEPSVDNPAPNRALLKSDFCFIKRYRTVPGPINFEQDVNQYVRYFSTPSTG